MRMHARLCRATLGLATLSLLLLHSPAKAQDTTKFARHRSIDFGLNTGFRENREIFRTIWFRDSLYGVIVSYHTASVKYFTSDGGRTWRSDSVPPFPQRYFDGGFAVGSGGMVSYDSGHSWTRFRIPDDSLAVVKEIYLDNRRFILCAAIAPGFTGWIYTSDSGTTWKRMVRGGRAVSTNAESQDPAKITEWPLPFYWGPRASHYASGPEPIGICEDSILYCTSTASVSDRGESASAGYLWRVNLSTDHVSWRLLVSNAQMDTLCIRKPARPIVPAHPFMETYWNEFINPDPFQGFVLDSATWFITGPYGFFARTDDAGQSWQRNDPAGRTLSVLALDDRILVGRDYGALLLSTDRGRTWDDVAQRGGLPPRVGGILALARVQGADNPRHLVAGCRYLPEPRGKIVNRFLESRNGGESWTLLPMQGDIRLSFKQDPYRLIAFGSGDSLTHLVIGAETGAFCSTDGGLNWTHPQSSYGLLVAMSDSLHGYRVVPGRIERTTDAGRSWYVVRDSFELFGPFVSYGRGFATSSPDHAVVLWARGADRYRGWTDDGGRTWTDERVEGGRDPHGAAHWIDSANIVMVGSGGSIELSTDAGRSWRVISDRPRDVPLGFWTYGNRMYVHSAEFNQAEMWDLDSLNPATVPMPILGDRPEGARLISHVGTTATLDLPRGSHELLLSDVLGRTRRLGSVEGPGTFAFDIGDAPDVLAFLVIRSSSGSVMFPLSGRP
jgi:photosystem II stability/assembly factor-like uncharacterized protein